MQTYKQHSTISSRSLDSKRDIQRFEAKLLKMGYKKESFGVNDDGYVDHYTKDGVKWELAVDQAAEGRRGVTGYFHKIS